MNKKVSSESVVKDIRRRTRKKYSSEEKIRIVLDGIPTSAVEKAFPPTYTTAGAKIFWKPVRSVSWETPPARRTHVKSLILKKRMNI